MSTMPVLQVINGNPMASSLEIAEHFEKEHFNVLQSIRTLFEHLPEKFTDLNFQGSEYQDSTGRTQPMFYLAKDGFSLLVMGFTGTAALEWKLKYIEAFNFMADTLFQMEEISLPWATPRIMKLLDRLPSFMHREYFRALVAVYSKLAPEEADKRSKKLLDVCRVFAQKGRATEQGNLMDLVQRAH